MLLSSRQMTPHLRRLAGKLGRPSARNRKEGFHHTHTASGPKQDHKKQLSDQEDFPPNNTRMFKEFKDLDWPSEAVPSNLSISATGVLLSLLSHFPSPALSPCASDTHTGTLPPKAITTPASQDFHSSCATHTCSPQFEAGWN